MSQLRMSRDVFRKTPEGIGGHVDSEAPAAVCPDTLEDGWWTESGQRLSAAPLQTWNTEY